MDTQNRRSPDADLFSAMIHVEEQKEALWTAWMDGSHENFEHTVRLIIEEVENTKICRPELNCSTPYQLGKLDGYTELFEQLFRAEKRMNMIRKDLIQHSPKARQILLCLYQNGDMRHGELAKAVGSSYSSLTNIMKKVLLSRAVESARSGKNTYYHLTDSGRRYCKQQLRDKNEFMGFLQMTIQESVSKAIQNPVESSPPPQRLNVKDWFVPVFNSEAYEPVVITSITTMGAIKFVGLSKAMVNTEEGERNLLTASVAGMRTNGQKVKVAENG